MGTKKSVLSGVRVLDLSRALAAPVCTQILGDLGAEVIKIERPVLGDETRTWGPPYVKDETGQDTSESAYYLSCNRNKKSVAIDFANPAGAEIIRKLAAKSDVLVENFKVGTLAKYSLDYPSLRHEFPHLIYCSITGYGQTGPYASRPGYDMLAQGIGGLISMTGEPGRPPVKVPIPVDDIITGLYGVISIFAALRHRDTSGLGQHIDLALLDIQVGWLYNQGLNYLIGGNIPKPLGTQSPNTVPYQVFATMNGWMILAANNDEQFMRFCKSCGHEELLQDDRFKTNPARVRNREIVIETVQSILTKKTTEEWILLLDEANVGCCPINTIDKVFKDPQVIARGMKITMPYALAKEGHVNLIANPIKMSETPVVYDHPPPRLGQHTNEILESILDMSAPDRETLRRNNII